MDEPSNPTRYAVALVDKWFCPASWELHAKITVYLALRSSRVMPIALTVFGVATNGLDPTLCYVLLRTVRGPGIYPEPTLPKDVATDGIRRSLVADTPLELVTWDKIIFGNEEVEFQAAIGQGSFRLPEECPIAGGQTISGLPFGPLIVDEESQRASISGVGLLYRKGIATEASLSALRDALDKALKSGATPRALELLVTKVAAESGIDEIFKKRRPIGGVDYFYRVAATTCLDGPLFNVVPEKPDFRTNDPMLRVHIRRHAAPLDQKFCIQISLGNYDEILCSVIRDIDAGIPGAVVSTQAHITDVSLNVFDGSGNLVDRLSGKFIQGMQFGLSALGAIDTLPPPFPGAPESADLEVRHRVHTSAFEGPSAGNRSGGLDVLRKQEMHITALIGPLSPKFENVWFERGAEGQIEVIRWIKKKIEQPGLAKAYLVDPYLGSDSLKRVVVRQGNETAKLSIVVSPGDIDPDAESAATSASSDYVAKLASTATDLADKLAGQISIVHIKRGDGSRQAFHDRYLCLVDQKGVPTAFLLSNSLSKAAGDWPFAICELSRVMSWRVYAYIQDIVEGRIVGLQPETVWKSAEAPRSSGSGTADSPVASASEPAWAAKVRALLREIWDVITRTADFQTKVGACIDAFLLAWPAGIDMEKFADALFKVVKHRDAIVVFTSSRLRAGGRGELADMLDDRLLSQVLDLLKEPDESNGWFLLLETRRALLGNLGKTIARKTNATNFVRDKLNPKVSDRVALIETQRFENMAESDAYQAAFFLSIIGLEVAISTNAPDPHRIGLATDYIHWIGRLMRSDVAAGRYAARDTAPAEWLDEPVYAAQTIAQARQVLGAALDEPIRRVMDDEWVTPSLKDNLAKR